MVIRLFSVLAWTVAGPGCEYLDYPKIMCYFPETVQVLDEGRRRKSGLLGFHRQGKELALQQRHCKPCWAGARSQQEQGSRYRGVTPKRGLHAACLQNFCQDCVVLLWEG